VGLELFYLFVYFFAPGAQGGLALAVEIFDLNKLFVEELKELPLLVRQEGKQSAEGETWKLGKGAGESKNKGKFRTNKRGTCPFLRPDCPGDKTQVWSASDLVDGAMQCDVI
jgi:hypothetical protein